MSKFMQIDVRLLPVYGPGGLGNTLPHLFKLLKEYRYDLVLEKEPSLYEMVEVLIRVRNDPQVPQVSKKPIAEKVDRFVKVRDQAREMLLARRLDDLDKLLYSLEDLFEELERDLG